MRLLHRPMQPGDIRECVDIVANHPVIGPRYGPVIEHLPEAWLSLLDSEALRTDVIHAEEGSDAPICLFGVSAIVRDDFLREMKTPPHFWLGPELTRRITHGESPLVTGKQLRDANSRGGLNLVCWEAGVRPEYDGHGEILRNMMSGFIQMHRGYLWKEVISAQSWSADHLDFILKTGGCLWDPLAGGYTSRPKDDLSKIAGKPHVVGITRDLEFKRQKNWTGSWAGALFDYHPPMLGFNRSEQRLLSEALRGATDEQLTEMLGISLPVVKKMWISIYGRIENSLPDLISDALPTDTAGMSRGREKRRHLLGYLREHPEELRPISRSSIEDRTKTNAVAP